MAALEDSSLGRPLGALVSPVKTFQSIATRPTWVVPLLLLALLGSVLGVLINHRIDMRRMLQRQTERMGQPMTEEQLDKAVERMQNRSPVLQAVSLVTGTIVQAIPYLLGAFLGWVVFKLAGSDLSFKESFATLVHACMPVALATLLTIPVVLSRTTVQPRDALTGDLLVSSPVFLLPADASPTVKAALAGFDVFNLWSLALFVVGYRIVARVSNLTATAAAVFLFLVGLGFRVGLVAFFSSFMG